MWRLATLTGLVACLAGCALDPAATPPSPVRTSFFDDANPGEVHAYHVLLRDCGFPACHGNEDRFFRVYGPGRTRLDGAAGRIPSDDEVDATFDRARSMLSGVDQVEDSLLLRKPLEIDRGGAPHLGIDGSGRDVYGSPEDDGYAILRDWAESGF